MNFKNVKLTLLNISIRTESSGVCPKISTNSYHPSRMAMANKCGTVVTWELFISYCASSSPSLIFHTCVPSEGTCYHVVHRVSHCCRYWHAGSLSKSDVNFRKIFEDPSNDRYIQLYCTTSYTSNFCLLLLY